MTKLKTDYNWAFFLPKSTCNTQYITLGVQSKFESSEFDPSAFEEFLGPVEVKMARL